MKHSIRHQRRTQVRFLENGIRFSFGKLPIRLGFLDVLEYYVRAISKSYKVKVRSIFSNLTTEYQIEETRDQDENSESSNQGAWQAYDSFASSLDAHTRKKRNLSIGEKSPESSPTKKQRVSPLSEEKTNVVEEEENAGWKRKRRRSRQSLNLDNLSDEDDGEVEIETKSQDNEDENDDEEFGQTQDISGFRRRRRRRS